jgi:hypothetical protein
MFLKAALSAEGSYGMTSLIGHWHSLAIVWVLKNSLLYPMCHLGFAILVLFLLASQL